MNRLAREAPTLLRMEAPDNRSIHQDIKKYMGQGDQNMFDNLNAQIQVKHILEICAIPRKLYLNTLRNLLEDVTFATRTPK